MNREANEPIIMLSILFVAFITTTNSTKLDGKKYLPYCQIRYNSVHLLDNTCEEVFELQPLCKKNLTVSYSSFPPYVFTDSNGIVQGLIPGTYVRLFSFFVVLCCLKEAMLYFILLYLYIEFMNVVFNQTCCLGCGGLKYLPEKNPDDLIRDQLSTDPKVLIT